MIYYSILYPPSLPITTPAFEIGKDEDLWRFNIEPSVGNTIDQFKSGFIQIRNSETARNALYPGDGGYLSQYIPFRNPFAEKIVLENETLNILQPKGYNETIPELKIDNNGIYYIELRHEVFNLSGSKTNVRYNLQVMLSNDWISSTLDYGKGTIQLYNEETLTYENIDMENYFGGNLVEKSLSEWSSISKVSPVSFANYFLSIDNNIIKSSIYEFIGGYEQGKNEDMHNSPNRLDAYKIDVYRAFGEEKEILIDSSDWIERKDNTTLNIRWQNKIELEDNKKYIIELTIQTMWELRKVIVYHIDTRFGKSLFKGTIKVSNDHDNARARVELETQTPLTWGPKENFEISEKLPDFALIDGEVSVEQGIDFFSKKGMFSGEMIISNINPIPSWDAVENKWFFKLGGPKLTPNNKFREEYYMYAHSTPVGRYNEAEGIPFEDYILINPVLESPMGASFRTYLETAKGTDLANVTTELTEEPPSKEFLYIEDEIGGVWETRITIDGEFTTTYSHQRDRNQFILPIFFYDKLAKILAKPMVNSETGQLYLSEIFTDYELGKNTAPQWINEFRFVKKVFALEINRETEIFKQTYKAYLTDYNRKLVNYMPIDPYHQYYIYFNSIGGQIRLIVRDITASLMGRKTSLDRYTSSTISGDSTLSNNLFLISDGLDEYFQTVKKDDGYSKPYAISIDERGALVANQAYISTTSSSSKTKTEMRERRGV